MAERSQRAHPRVSTSISVSMRLPDGRTVSTGSIRNISLGGVFVEMDEPLGFGKEFDMEFRLPNSPDVIRCRGLVMWNTVTQPNPLYSAPGMGVRLMKIGVQEMRKLADFIDSELKH